MTSDSASREQLIQVLRGGHAHATFDDVIRDFPGDRIGVRPAGAPHSAWELLEHLRIAQNDILQFSRSAEHVSPKWPDGYWPKSPAPQRASQWDESVRAFHNDLSAFEALIQDPAQDLHRKFPWGDGQTLFREALLIADHNSYHLGQLVLVRRLVGAWDVKP
ncbi:MAG: DinB family protein [Acidobacteriia bacterium]|nr:DinB family protein [Terriglobia bacterium]